MKKEKLITNYLEMGPFDGNFLDFPSYFFDKDTIFHYSKTETTLNYILKNNQLLLSERSSSIDPMERKTPSQYSEWVGKRSSSNTDSSEIHNKLSDYYKNLKQLCFCYNKGKLIIPLTNGYDKINFEYLGCLKPRMWDQYGDHYNGVCLVFSQKLIEKHSGLKFKKIKYFDFSNFLGRKIVVQENDLDYNGENKYFKNLKQKYEKIYCHKHKDYEHETEIRLYSDSAIQNPLFDFKDSLKAIIINAPHKLGKENYYAQILEYAQTKNIDLISLNWAFDGFYVDVLNRAR